MKGERIKEQSLCKWEEPFTEKGKNVVKETAEKQELLAMWEMGGCLTL